MDHDMSGMAGGGGGGPGMGAAAGSPTAMPMHHKMMMHMTFFWGNNAEILFDGWPGERANMYALVLVFVFAMAILVEWLSDCRIIQSGLGSSPFVAGLGKTVLHMLRVGLAYMVMLAVMSFNAGVFLAAVAGHTLGFLVFGSQIFKKNRHEKLVSNSSDLPPMSC